MSQYNSFPLYTNMAMAGSKGCSRIVMGTRLQWLKLDGGYRTTYISYDQYSRHLRSGFGIQYYNNNEADGRVTNDIVHFVFSPSISVGKRGDDSLRAVVIKPAFNFGVLKYRINWNKYSPGDHIDPLYGFIYSTSEVKNKEVISAPDFGAGMFVYGKKFFAGLYFQHITEPEIGVLFPGSPFPMKVTVIGGYQLKGYEWLKKIKLTPSFIYENQDAAGSRMDISVLAQYRHYLLGVGGRLGSSFIFKAGVENKFCRIGYSYDLNATHAAWGIGSTHEITLGYYFAHREKHKRIRTLDVYSF